MKAETQIINLRRTDEDLIDRLAPLVHDAFQEHSPGWLPTVADARDEILESLEPHKMSRVLMDASRNPLAWIGVTPRNSGRIWEIHPFMVAVSEQGKGYGRHLMYDIELLARNHNVLTLELGTGDLTNATTLSGVDLYEDPARAIASIRALKRHPYTFYVKMGFKVVGIMPDADGPGKPGIILAKRVGTR